MAGEPLSQLVSTYLAPARAGPTLIRILAEEADPGVYARSLVRTLLDNPLYGQSILSLPLVSQKISEWDQDEPELRNKDQIYLERLLSLFGKTPVRNLVACARLARISGTRLAVKVGTPPGLAPREQLIYAMGAEELCTEHKLVNPALAFSAGYHYDALAALILAAKAPPDAKVYLQTVYDEGVRWARVSTLLGSRIKVFEEGPRLFSAALVTPIGKALMHLIYPKSLGERSWAQCLVQVAKFSGHYRQALALEEAKRFAYRHEELSQLMIRFVGLLESSGEAIAHYRHPYYLKAKDPRSYALAMVLGLAGAAIAWDAGGAKGPVRLEPFQKVWLAQAGLKEIILIQCINKLKKEAK